MKDNIILIGMPGVGKSTIGVVLAKVLGYEFIDADLIIQKQTGKLLKDIITEEGLDGFMEIENRICSSIDVHKSVIATGGSAVFGKDAMEHFSNIGKVVYLELDLPSLRRRLGNLKNRGVVVKKGQTLKDIYEERVPLYKKYAEITVNEKGYSISKTVDKIIKKL